VRPSGRDDGFDKAASAAGAAHLGIHVQILKITGCRVGPGVRVIQEVHYTDEHAKFIARAEAVNSAVVEACPCGFCGGYLKLNAVKCLIGDHKSDQRARSDGRSGAI
jgi:hypothetical protein